MPGVVRSSPAVRLPRRGGLAAVSVATFVSASPQAAPELGLSPSEAFPLREIAIIGLPKHVDGLGFRAIPLDEDGRQLGDGIALHAVRLDTEAPVFVFAIGHEQYAVGLRAIVGVVAVVFVYPWIAARTLWAPWIPHTLGDIIGDSIVKL
jgi:hypothetical protein